MGKIYKHISKKRKSARWEE